MNPDLIKEKARAIDGIIEGFLPQEEGPAKTVMEAMNYSIRVGGKRLRPMIMKETYDMFGGDHPEEELYPFMAAIEMIHTYSLCHDDLPAMDNDMYRRGKLSTHAKFGEAMGILAGDGLLNYAFETALKAFGAVPEDAPDAMRRVKNISRALAILAQKAGIGGMIGGQVADIESEEDGAQVSMDTVTFIHEHKTAAMIESSMMIGAVLAGADEDELDIMEKTGSDVGLAFQIMDDILDVTGDEESLGKPVGSDEKNGKTTYVSLVGLEKARKDVEDISQRALSNLAGLAQSGSESGRFLRYLIERLICRDR